MEPWDALTDEDRDELVGYIKSYGNVDLDGDFSRLRTVLDEWNRKKDSLFNDVFGNKLRVRIPVTTVTQRSETQERLKGIYRVPYIGNRARAIEDYLECHMEDAESNAFVHAVLMHIQRMQDRVGELAPLRKEDCLGMAYAFVEMITYSWVMSNRVPRELGYKCMVDGKLRTVRVEAGAKTVKTVRTFLSNIGFERMDMFDSWREAVSVATTVKSRDVDLVLSIHPIDFMTMSDNDCNWTSCMRWNGGEYSNGTVEMMNSEYVIVGYIESGEKPTMLRCGHYVPNKSWRCLFYVTDEMILSGKAYPYSNSDVSKSGVEALKGMVEKEYGPVMPYDDMDWYYNNYDGTDMSSPYTVTHLDENDYDWTFDDSDVDYDDDECPYSSREEFVAEQVDRRVVVAVGDFMYNDFYEDANNVYWCAKAVGLSGLHGIDLGGACTCMCCGNVVYEDNLYEVSDKYCSECGDSFKCDDDVLYPGRDIYECELDDGESVRMTEEAMREQLWWRPYTESFTRKGRRSHTNKTAYVVEHEYDDGFKALATESDEVFEDYVESLGDTRFEKADIHTAWGLAESSEMEIMNVAQRYRKVFFVCDLDEFDREAERFREVEEVDIDDELQSSRAVRV